MERIEIFNPFTREIVRMPKSRRRPGWKPRAPRYRPQKDQIRFLASKLPDQAALNAMLLQEPDVEKRKLIFEYVKPYLWIKNPEFPTTIIKPDLIVKP